MYRCIGIVCAVCAPKRRAGHVNALRRPKNRCCVRNPMALSGARMLAARMSHNVPHSGLWPDPVKSSSASPDPISQSTALTAVCRAYSAGFLHHFPRRVHRVRKVSARRSPGQRVRCTTFASNACVCARRRCVRCVRSWRTISKSLVVTCVASELPWQPEYT